MSATEPVDPPEERQGLAGRLAALRGQGGMVWVALGVLVLVSLVLEPSTLGSSALLSMLPFAAILAIAAVGQGLTIQQGGLDFSVAGSISFAAIIVAGHASGDGSKLLESILLALGAVLVAGLLNGLAITWLKITPIIATLAVNALLVGGIVSYSGGTPKSATDNLSNFAVDKTLGIPNTVLIALVFVLVAAFILNFTVVGRRFVAIGTSKLASQAAGLPVGRYVIVTYMLAALCYGTAGIVLAGYIKSPAIDSGNPYLLSTITAVVVGGTALGGGRGRLIGTAVAALFLSQLDALIAALGAEPSISLLVQSAAIAVAAGFGAVVSVGNLRRLVRRPVPAGGQVPP